MDDGSGNDYGYPQHREAYQAVYEEPREHEGKLSHELLGGAAAFAAMRAYEKHQEANGRPPKHQLAKEILAGFVGAEVDKLVETKGLDEVDAVKAKHQARKEAEQMFDQSYGRQYVEGGQQYGSGGPPYGGQQYGGASYEGQRYEGEQPCEGRQYGGPPQPYRGQQYGGEYRREY